MDNISLRIEASMPPRSAHEVAHFAVLAATGMGGIAEVRYLANPPENIKTLEELESVFNTDLLEPRVVATSAGESTLYLVTHQSFRRALSDQQGIDARMIDRAWDTLETHIFDGHRDATQLQPCQCGIEGYVGHVGVKTPRPYLAGVTPHSLVAAAPQLHPTMPGVGKSTIPRIQMIAEMLQK